VSIPRAVRLWVGSRLRRCAVREHRRVNAATRGDRVLLDRVPASLTWRSNPRTAMGVSYEQHRPRTPARSRRQARA
jgi:hypothetical protein